VTAYYDLQRADRSNEQYFEWMQRTLWIPVPMVIYTSPDLAPRIHQLVGTRPDTLIQTRPFMNLTLATTLHRVESILASQEYQTRIQEGTRIECTHPQYAILQFSKFEFVRHVGVHNPFSSEFIGWVDAGLGKHLTKNVTLGTDSLSKKWVLKSFPNAPESTYPLPWSNTTKLAGGFFLSHRSTLDRVITQLERVFYEWLDQGIVNNEQVALYQVYQRFPSWFDARPHQDPQPWGFNDLFQTLEIFSRT
jgi:hypothetical protein